jgi:hypothetical protein
MAIGWELFLRMASFVSMYVPYIRQREPLAVPKSSRSGVLCTRGEISAAWEFSADNERLRAVRDDSGQLVIRFALLIALDRHTVSC